MFEDVVRSLIAVGVGEWHGRGGVDFIRQKFKGDAHKRLLIARLARWLGSLGVRSGIE